MSPQSRRSLMIRVIMKWSWGPCTDLLAFALQPRKPQLEDRQMKGLWNQSSPQMGSLTPNAVDRIAQNFRKWEGKDRNPDLFYKFFCLPILLNSSPSLKEMEPRYSNSSFIPVTEPSMYIIMQVLSTHSWNSVWNRYAIMWQRGVINITDI